MYMPMWYDIIYQPISLKLIVNEPYNLQLSTILLI